MGYSDIKSRKQHEADAAKIAELEKQLRVEREKKTTDQRAGDQARNHLNDTVTVEKTSKKLKGRLVISWVAIFLGVLAFPLNVPAGAVVLAVGVFALVYTKIQIWWRHG